MSLAMPWTSLVALPKDSLAGSPRPVRSTFEAVDSTVNSQTLSVSEIIIILNWVKLTSAKSSSCLR